ncbi:hypothetical protein HT031_003498 [Scenedesmus sp. PABB004]|nr:hypothetical protein HT031_003498 [Scenedesmus sp. PABB004]
MVLFNDAVELRDIQQLLADGAVHHIVLSPGPGSPHTPADIGVCMDVLRHCTTTPVLGVCLGHQALAAAAGARVVRAPEPVHGRLSGLRHNGDALFKAVPSGPGRGFDVVRYHSLVVDPASLPPELEPLAWTCGATHAVPTGTARPRRAQAADDDGGESLLMALRHRGRPHWGVQFHPESIATRYGQQLLLNFRDLAHAHSGATPPAISVPGVGPPGRELPPRPWPAPHAWAASAAGAGAAPAGGAPPQEHAVPLGPSGWLSADGGEAGQLQLAWVKLPGALAATGGSAALFSALVGPGPDSFWLDSACAPERCTFSYMGGAPLAGPLGARVTYKLPPAAQQPAAPGGAPPPGQLTVARLAPGGGAAPSSSSAALSVWPYLEQQLAALALAPGAAAEAAAALPFDFWGGFVGYLGYELKAETGGAPRHDADTPDAAWLFADRLVAVDHAAGDVYALATHAPGDDAARAAQAWLARATADVAALAGGLPAPAQPGGSPAAAAAVAAADATLATAAAAAAGGGHARAPPQQQQVLARLQQQLQEQQVQQQQQLKEQHQQQLQQQRSLGRGRAVLRHDRAAYEANVRSCQEALTAGESYELCLTTQFAVDDAPPAWDFYSTLRSVNPAPYAAWLRIAPGSGAGAGGALPGVTVACSSPERFLSCGRGGVLEAKPIKGTARRHPGDPAADAAAAAALLGSAKEAAENLMIVDLLRNDLGRVCEPGSVHVPGLIQLESYATVHQLVSTVRGLRRGDTSPVAALRAAFPGGSMTGAPKVRSLALLDDLEGGPRGVYSGALGWLGLNDTFDMNIVIRTAVFTDSDAPDGAAARMTVGAGGAVTVQSDPGAEYEEMELKGAALLAAAALAAGAAETQFPAPPGQRASRAQACRV